MATMLIGFADYRDISIFPACGMAVDVDGMEALQERMGAGEDGNAKYGCCSCSLAIVNALTRLWMFDGMEGIAGENGSRRGWECQIWMWKLDIVKRYLDLMLNMEVRQIFKTRAKIISYIRSFLTILISWRYGQGTYSGYKIKYHANGLDKDPIEIDFTPLSEGLT
ncbi:hypothetical protein CK203_055899 [Vitis vinifera]|uniref:Uncharacterized protein n=1 Tax=Vitis vinifera TaxID=29760 RepID=A0A438FTZ7_VITVI|nr:hypothetical protein CK203_055899 [Vitis vinifera]